VGYCSSKKKQGSIYNETRPKEVIPNCHEEGWGGGGWCCWEWGVETEKMEFSDCTKVKPLGGIVSVNVERERAPGWEEGLAKQGLEKKKGDLRCCAQ